MSEEGNEQGGQQSWRSRLRRGLGNGSDSEGSREEPVDGEANGGGSEEEPFESGASGGASPTRAERGDPASDPDSEESGSEGTSGGGSFSDEYDEDYDEDYAEDYAEGDYEDEDEDYEDEDYEDEERYENWGEYLRENPRTGLLGAGLVLGVLLLVVVAASSLLGGGGEEQEAADEGGGGGGGNGGQQESAEVSGPPVNAGGLSVSTDGGSVEVSASGSDAVGEGGEWSGDLSEGEQNAATVNLTPSSEEPAPGAGAQASMTSVLSEDGIRSWLGLISDTSRADGVVLEASQSSDPGAAALDGEMALVKGTYVAKGSEDGYSASGTYRDTLLDQSTVRRIYEETYVVGGGDTQTRSWAAEYNVSGDAALVPFLIGYAPPEGVGSGPEGTPQDEAE